MSAIPMLRFGFRVRTRNGALVENLSICGRDADEAERKLRQMYHGCEILEARQQSFSGAWQPGSNYEDVMRMITAA